MQRISDITLGDFWGIETLDKAWDDNKGISLILVNTNKGTELLELARGDLELRSFNAVPTIAQVNLLAPTAKPQFREQFWNDYHKFGFKYIQQKYLRLSVSARLKRLLATGLNKVGLYYFARNMNELLKTKLKGKRLESGE